MTYTETPRIFLLTWGFSHPLLAEIIRGQSILRFIPRATL